jgi:hypothetical protein
MSVASREIRLTSRPLGTPTVDNFELVETEVPDPAPNEVRVRNLWMTVDPYMRSRMSDAPSYMPPFELGKVMSGSAIGEVEASNVEGLRPGDLVTSFCGWREVFNAPAGQLKKLDSHGLPAQAVLGSAGGSGLAAYAGLLEVARLRPGDVVFISAAAGAVGQVACQIAKLKGNQVIGSAGGPRKTAFLRDLGLDGVIDHRSATDLKAALAAAAPEGIDVYFDNVGGAHLEAALAVANPGARFALCGMISQYNVTDREYPVDGLVQIVKKRLRLEGFLVSSYLALMPQFLEEFAGWVAEGKMIWRETVVEGLENAPEAFLKLFSGDNFGKIVVKLAR